MAYRILSLDGGGAWAAIEIMTLMDLHGPDATGHQVLAEYDMVAGSSAGSIVLAGLVEDMPLTRLLALFMDDAERRALFHPLPSIWRILLRRILQIGPLYSVQAKHKGLRELLPRAGGLTLAEAARGIKGPRGEDIHLLIVAFDYDRHAGTYFRSAETAGEFGLATPANVTLADAVHASSTAPVNYFEQPATLPGCPDRYWDGGLTGNNNPALIASVEAIALGADQAALRVLSLGTGTVRLPLHENPQAEAAIYAVRERPALITDLKRLATSIMDDPPDFATFVTHVMTGGARGLPEGLSGRIVRANPLVCPLLAPEGYYLPGGWKGDRFAALCSVDMDAARPGDMALIQEWCQLWLADGCLNQAIKMNEKTMATVIGHATYSEAKSAWLRLRELA